MKLFCQANVPVNQNVVYKSESDALKAPVGELDIRLNETTGLIYNYAFNPEIVNYSEEYDNNQVCSDYFSDYIDRQIDYLIEKYISRAATIVEVGCGKGYYIKKIAERLKTCKAYGFDTSYVPDVDKTPSTNLHFYREYYDEKYASLKPDVVISRHVIEHIHNPTDFLQQIRATMPDNALLFLETPDVNWILKNAMVYDFFYEHCSYWNASSMEYALKASGFVPLEIRTEFDAQYMWIVARAAQVEKTPVLLNSSKLAETKQICNKFLNARENENAIFKNFLQATK
jgi:2-polyprenyl-3-methyl-5-hydroxy-6-metoxy-1,4-benzoquinol methylase